MALTIWHSTRLARNHRAARQGRHGQVYRARNLKLKREVANKILPEEEMATRATLAALDELKPCEAASISPRNNQSE